MRKYDFPIVVRQTLTSAALDVKTITMPDTSRTDFIHRKATFFKANSRAEKATGFDIDMMRAVVGFKPKPGDKSHSVEDLDAQEEGTDIGYSRAFVALSTARVGAIWQGLIRNKNKRNGQRDFAINAAGIKSRYAPTEKSKYVLAAIEAAKSGRLVIGSKINQRGNKMAWRPDHINRFFGNTYVVATPLFAVKKDRRVVPPATHFMHNASDTTATKMPVFFIVNAERRLNKVP